MRGREREKEREVLQSKRVREDVGRWRVRELREAEREGDEGSLHSSTVSPSEALQLWI